MKDDDIKSNVDNIALTFDILFHKDCTDYIESLNLDIQPDQIDVVRDKDNIKRFLDDNAETIENTYYAVQPGFFVPGDDAEETKDEHESFEQSFKKYVQQNQRELSDSFELWYNLPVICKKVLIDNISLFKGNDADYLYKTVLKPTNYKNFTAEVADELKEQNIRTQPSDEDIQQGILAASIYGFLDGTAFDDL